MKYLFIILLFSMKCFAEGFIFINPSELSIVGKKFLEGSRNPLLENYATNVKPTYQIDLNINYDVLLFLYWNNKISTITDQNQFKTVAWNYEFGIHILDFLDFFYEHNSQHILDYSSSKPYPIEDWIGIRLDIYNPNKNHYNILFPWRD